MTDMTQKMLDAVEREDLAQIEILTKPSSPPFVLGSLLNIAIDKGKEQSAIKIIELGADVHQVTGANETKLLRAAEKGMDKLCEKLIDEGVPIDKADYFGNTPLIAAAGSHVSTSLMLIEKGAKIHSANTHKDTALTKCFELKSEAVCLRLLKKGAKFDDGDPQSLLLQMASLGFTKCCLWALRNGAKINEIFAGITALHVAAAYGHVGTCRLLRKKGASLELRNTSNDTPLLSAALLEKGKETCKYLIAEGADIHAIGNNDNSVLINAADGKNEELCLQLIEAGVDPHHKNKSKISALSMAVDRGLDKVCLRLIDKDVAPGMAERNKLLVAAIDNGLTGTALKLLEKGADPDAQDENGKTALMLAIKTSNTAVFAALQHYGADMYAVTKDDETLMDFAIKSIAIQPVRRLLHYGYRFTDKQKQEQAPLIKLVEQHVMKQKCDDVFDGEKPTLKQCIRFGRPTGALLDACVLGKFDELVANPLLSTKTHEDLATFKEIWDKLPEHLRRREPVAGINYAKARGTIQMPQGIAQAEGRDVL